MPPVADPVQQSLENLRLERDATWLYDRLAGVERDDARAAAFRRIADNERRHAGIWAASLERRGVAVPPATGPRLRVRTIALIARLFGTAAVSDLVQALEGDEEDLYTKQSTPEVAAIAADEREHARIWRELDGSRAGRERIAANRRPPGSARQRPRRPRQTSFGRAMAPSRPLRDLQGGRLRGVGWAREQPRPRHGHRRRLGPGSGAHPARGDRRSARRRLQHGCRRVHLDAEPARAVRAADRPRARRARGDARGGAGRARRGVPIEGLQPRGGGPSRGPHCSATRSGRSIRSSGRSSGSTQISLGQRWVPRSARSSPSPLGAAVPVIPYLFGGGPGAFWASIILSLLALFGVGAAVSLLTGRSTLFSGARQVAIGAAAAIVTYAVGTIIGVGVAG